MERKPIKLKNETRDMTIEEVYIQFKNFIYKICQSWLGKYEFDDLTQAAFIGLNKAYESYDISKDILFLTYASMVINNELKIYHRKNKKHGNNISLSTTYSSKDNDSLELEDMLADQTNYENIAITNIECEDLRLAIQKLNSEDKRIVELIAFNYKNQKEVSEELNLSQSAISRKYKKAIEKLRHIIEKGEIIMPVKRITRKQLIEEVRKHGTDKEATNLIAEKYGLKSSTIRSYYDEWDVRKESKNYQGNKTIDDVSKVKSSESESVNTILRPILKGNIGDYEIQNNEVNIIIQNNSIIIGKENINMLILELQELNKFLG
ncbi:sigma-70 family RNA polymerase sigma factor [Clostridium cagae]|uniref:sigma-70 family RNA polymerase sigma factor n=1 Tax=Clostridium cagae TaxID=2080751 RepID=UPI003F757E5F